MDALEALKTRRSIRAYAKKPVSRELLEELVDCGRLAATARNVQPWRFVVVTDEKKKKEIAARADYGSFIADAAACIAVVAEDTKYYLEDGSAATENILAAAHAMGLAACWVAGDKKGYAPDVLSLLGAPSDAKLVSLIAVGYAGGAPPDIPKKPLEDILCWESYRP